MQVITGIEQGSDEWKALRLGVVTASRFKDVLSGGQGKTRLSYMRELAAEILTGEFQDSYSNKYMEWGTETEPQARAMYELRQGVDVEEVSFVQCLNGAAGCSPDGLVGDSGLVEFKCPKTTTQIETFLNGEMPSSHKAQVQGQLWVTGRDWCDFVSFDPRINGDASWFCTRVHADGEYIRNLEESVNIFINELNVLVKKLKGE